MAKHKFKLSVKLRFLFKLKLRIITFFDYFIDTTNWKMNFISDLHDYPDRYFKTFVEPPEMSKEEGGGPSL